MSRIRSKSWYFVSETSKSQATTKFILPTPTLKTEDLGFQMTD